MEEKTKKNQPAVPDSVPGQTLPVPEVSKSKPKLKASILIAGIIIFLIIIGTISAVFMHASKQNRMIEEQKTQAPSVTQTPAVSKLEDSFTIKVPEGWTSVSANSNADTYGYGNEHGFLIFSPDFKKGGEDESTGVVIQINRKPASKNEDIQKEVGSFYTNLLSTCKETIKPIAIGGIDGYEATCDRVLGIYESSRSYNRYYLIEKGQYVWSIQSFARQTSQDYISQIDQILSNFEFTDQNQTTDTSNWRTYKDTEGSFTFMYPTDLRLGIGDKAVNLTNFTGQEGVSTIGIYVQLTSPEAMRGTEFTNISKDEFYNPSNSIWLKGNAGGGGSGTTFEIPQVLTVGNNQFILQVSKPTTNYESSSINDRDYNYYHWINTSSIAKITLGMNVNNPGKEKYEKMFQQILSSFKFTK